MSGTLEVNVAPALSRKKPAKAKLRSSLEIHRRDSNTGKGTRSVWPAGRGEAVRTRISDLKEFPRDVIEYLINQFCPGEDFEAEIASVRRKLASNYASPADAPRILHQLKQKRQLDLIARAEVRLETSEDKYWAAIAALNERNIHISENLINKYPDSMGGMRE